MQFFLFIFCGASSQNLPLLATFQESISSALILSVGLACFPNQSSCPGLALLQSLILSGERWLHDLVSLWVPACFWHQHHGEISMGLLETLESGRALPWSSSSCLNRGTVQLVVPTRDAINYIYELWSVGYQNRIWQTKQPWRAWDPMKRVSALLGGNLYFLGRSIYSVGQLWKLKGRKLQSMKLRVKLVVPHTLKFLSFGLNLKACVPHNKSEWIYWSWFSSQFISTWEKV